MLSFFTSKIKEYPEVRTIVDNISEIYCYFSDKKYDLIKALVDASIDICNNIKEQSVINQEEEVANSTYVMKCYLKLLKEYASYWELLQSGEYRKSWGDLQNCIDNLIIVCKFTENRSSFNLEHWEYHLGELEKLYPFKIFASSEMINHEEKCSICGREIADFECYHIPGNLYWGEMAYIEVGRVVFIAVALVKHPLDKRCVMEVQGDNRPEAEKFGLLNYFIENVENPFTMFELKEIPELYFNEKYRSNKRNDICPCGSGKKFKKCCGKEKYESGIHYRIVLKDCMPIRLLELSNIA